MGGADKALLALGGRPLLGWLHARLAPQVAQLAVSANGDPDRFAACAPQLPILADAADLGPLGPLSGILAGLDWAAATGATALVSVPVDSPFVPQDLVTRLQAGAAGKPGFARAGRDHYATAIWPVALAGALRRFLASGAKPRIADFAQAHGAVAVDFPDAAAFDNLNYPQDLAAALARLQAAEGGAA